LPGQFEIVGTRQASHPAEECFVCMCLQAPQKKICKPVAVGIGANPGQGEKLLDF